MGIFSRERCMKWTKRKPLNTSSLIRSGTEVHMTILLERFKIMLKENVMKKNEKKSTHSTVVLCFMFLLLKCQAQFTQTPVNISASGGTIGQFDCTAEGVSALTYLVNSMFIAEFASFGVQESAPVYNGNLTSVSLYVPATKDTTNLSVVCAAMLPDGKRVASPPAYLQVQAPPAPQNLTANVTGATWVLLTWSPPNDTGLGGVLSYRVSYQQKNYTITITTYNPHLNVTGLFPNTTYTMTVMADNGISGNEGNRTVSVNVTTKDTATPNDTIGTPDGAISIAGGVGGNILVVVALLVLNAIIC